MKEKKIVSEPIKTLLVIVLGLVFVYFLTHWKGWLTIAFVLGVIGLISSWCAKKIDWLWMKLAALLGLIIPNILLSLVFYLFLTPIAWLSRLGKKDPLMLKNKHTSLFKDHGREFDKASFEKTW
ncbi:MAG: hypothetical protein LBR13_06870 [Dysgonamonadaceae bacterium]|jgi:hypothetical protein|nr:hypothetical protein [Dysgonamonadaceae bacterium]